MSHYHFQPIQGRGRLILDAVIDSPEFADCTFKERLTLRLACEEIIMNVIFYAYPENPDGFIDVDVQKTPLPAPAADSSAADDAPADSGSLITISFADGGIPFNPLEREKPDTLRDWHLRDIGGLGIFLVIKKMDDVRYAYADNKNILTIEKRVAK